MEKITIEINGYKFCVYSINNAITLLKNLNKNKSVITHLPRCSKCVWENACNSSDIDGKCTDYKRDPPDGGYYG